ncbi:FAD binding domain-containing protein [Mycobacterium sp. NPDC003449]
MVQIVSPATLREAVDIMRGAEGDAKYLAGGTALVLLVKMRMVNPETLISLRHVTDLPDWDRVTVNDTHVRIGGGVTLAQLAADPSVLRLLPSVAHAADVVGNIRIRNCATVGGLMAEADYASDPPATMVSLDASVRLSNGDRVRDIAVADFITDFFTTELEDDEVVIGVSVPRPRVDTHSAYLKFSSRSAEDRPCVGVAASAGFDGDTLAGLRIVVGAVSGRPQWFPDITAPLLGTCPDAATVAAVADAYADSVDPVDDIRGSAWYRRQVVRAQVTRALATIGVGVTR